MDANEQMDRPVEWLVKKWHLKKGRMALSFLNYLLLPILYICDFRIHNKSLQSASSFCLNVTSFSAVVSNDGI